MRAADAMVTTVTITTAPRYTRCVHEPTFLSGRPSSTASATVHAPAAAVGPERR
jgi:hypothetical protein